MITEAVVADPGNYPDCGKYLGDLFGGNKNSSSELQLQQRIRRCQQLRDVGRLGCY